MFHLSQGHLAPNHTARIVNAQEHAPAAALVEEAAYGVRNGRHT